MSLFKNPQIPDGAPSEDRLREWGEAERTAPPTRRGRFAAVADRLTRGAGNAAGSPAVWYRPAFAIGGVSLVAFTVAYASLTYNPSPAEPDRTRMLANVYTPAPSAPADVSTVVRVLAGREEERPERPLTKYDGGLSVRAEPVFIGGNLFAATLGLRDSAVVPISVTVKNTGAASAAKISVEIGDPSAPTRIYTYPVTLLQNATLQTTVYPEMTSAPSTPDRQNYSVYLLTADRRIHLDSGFAMPLSVMEHTDTSNADPNRYMQDYESRREHLRSVAILDKRIGVLSPRIGRPGASGLNYSQYRTMYAKPWNAPDRAAGYDAVDVLALGHGCERLTPVQWTAIREWVKDGGSLVLLGGSDAMRRVMQVPEFLDLSPAAAFGSLPVPMGSGEGVSSSDIDQGQNTYFSGMGTTLRFTHPLSTVSRIKADATTILSLPMWGGRVLQGLREHGLRRHDVRFPRPSEDGHYPAPFGTEWATIGAHRALGAGTVSFYGFDPTAPAFRDDPELATRWWSGVSSHDKGTVPARKMITLASDYSWDSGSQQDLRRAVADNNPFVTELPDLKIVLYVFLGYFVLVVPVSFVVLKQTRRMQYAWFTGPVLALTFAGGLALFTRSLYSAAQSVRTSGVVALEAGESTARFHGVTELYVPRARRVNLRLPGTQASFSGSRANHGNVDMTTFLPRLTDDGSGEQAPAIEIPNLSFRRLYHSQTMTLGEGITATVRPGKPGTDTLTATVTNKTGASLHNGIILLRGEQTVFHDDATYVPVWEWMGSELPVGDTEVVLKPREYGKHTSWSGPVFLGATVATLVPGTPVLAAQMSGKAFSPEQCGRWVGGEASVKMIAKLPPVPLTMFPRYIPPQPGAIPGGLSDFQATLPTGFGAHTHEGGSNR